MRISLSTRGRPLDLPAPTGAAAGILQCAGQEAPSAQAILAVLDGDSLLARRFHRLSRSSLFNGGSGRASLGEMVLAMEPEVLRNVAMVAAVVHLLPAERGGDGFDRFRLWEHSAAVGTLARLLARDFDLDSSSAFAAGLLHDMGRLVLDVHFPREFSAVLQYQVRHDTWIRDAESAVLGYDHCVLGERVARAWGLPAPLVEAIGAHHQPERRDPAPVRELTAVVHVADILARGLQVGYPGDDTIPMLSEPTLRRLGLNWSSLRDCLGDAEPALQEARRLVREAMLPEV